MAADVGGVPNVMAADEGDGPHVQNVMAADEGDGPRVQNVMAADGGDGPRVQNVAAGGGVPHARWAKAPPGPPPGPPPPTNQQMLRATLQLMMRDITEEIQTLEEIVEEDLREHGDQHYFLRGVIQNMREWRDRTSDCLDLA